MSEKRNRDYAKFDSMTTGELEAILRSDASAPEAADSDTEELLYVMEVLANRKKKNNTGKTALEAWESFEQNYLADEVPPDPANRKDRSAGFWLRRLTVAAAIIALVILLPITSRAFSWGEFWNFIAHWAKETFSFVSGDPAEASDPDVEYNAGAASLQELLRDCEHDPSIVPTWIPEGFLLNSIKRNSTPLQEIYLAYYTYGDRDLTVRIRSYIQKNPENVEVDDNLLELYEADGTQYYIFSNMDQLQAIWIIDSYQCSISGDISIEDIKCMIDSIEKG